MFGTNEEPSEPVENQDEIDSFLDALRSGGSVNMFEAPRLIQEAFGLSKKESNQAFFYWADNFGS